MNTCVFCLEEGDKNRPLLHNVKCRCNYCFHLECYQNYRTKTICPLCRGSVGELFIEDDDSITFNPVQVPVSSPVTAVTAVTAITTVSIPTATPRNEFRRIFLQRFCICLWIVVVIFLILVFTKVI